MLLSNSTFNEITYDEMQNNNGGGPITTGIVVGVTLYVMAEADEQLEQNTGKDAGDWIQHGAEQQVDSWGKRNMSID